MCGIVGYSGSETQVLDTLISGLKRLEYRGYDSAGIAVHEDHAVYAQRAAGKVAELEKSIKETPPTMLGSVGIAHTRWATHGLATKNNAHPHHSQDKKIWLVHNGIIENYQEIKFGLVKKGVKFKTETDTEVIAQLVAHNYQGDLKQAVLDTIPALKGAFALAVISAEEPTRLIGVKNSSPLVVGIAKDEVILASDVAAIIDRTKKVIYLEDEELIDINGANYEIVNFTDQLLDKKITNVDWDFEAATKQGYEHFLIKEISEQPQVIHDSTRGRLLLAEADVRFGGLIDIESRLKSIKRVVLMGVGTAHYAAKLGEIYFNALSGLPAMAVISPEYRYTKNFIDKDTWVIAVSQSGETADTLAAIEEAKRHKALVTGIVNVVGSSVARATEAGVYNHIGPEISVASTKAFTSQSLILLMHAIMMGRKHTLGFSGATQIINAITKLPKTLEKLLKTRDKIEMVAKRITKYTDLLYIGRQFNYPIALEGALKIKEVAYIHAEGLSAGELKHGFIALIDKNLPTIAIATNDAIQDKMLANIEEIKARGGPVFALGNKIIPTADETILVPRAGSDYVQPLVNNVALQLLAYYVARERKVDIDQPRNLAKSVTVE